MVLHSLWWVIFSVWEHELVYLFNFLPLAYHDKSETLRVRNGKELKARDLELFLARLCVSSAHTLTLLRLVLLRLVGVYHGWVFDVIWIFACVRVWAGASVCCWHPWGFSCGRHGSLPCFDQLSALNSCRVQKKLQVFHYAFCSRCRRGWPEFTLNLAAPNTQNREINHSGRTIFQIK